MENALHRPRLLHRISLCTPPLASSRLRILEDESISVSFAFAMPRNLILRRFSANRAQDPGSFFRFNTNTRHMASSKSDHPPQEQSRRKEKEEEIEPKKVVPPPPEQPLPGDCCGSGCVRCVWDVYYEELEEYNNKINKTGSDKSESGPS